MHESVDPTPELPDRPAPMELDHDLVKALRKAEDPFRALVDLLPIRLMIIRAGKILYANPGLVRLLGYEKAEELIARSPLPLFPDELQEIVRHRIKRITDSESLYNPPIDLKMIRKNGEIVSVEAESVATLYQGVFAIMVILRDITSRKAAEESLRMSEENFRSILQAIPDGIIIHDRENVLFTSRSLVRMLGYDKEEELSSLSPFDLVHPDHYGIALERIDRMEERGSSRSLREYHWVKKDGSRLEVEVSSIPVLYREKSALIAVVRDITARIDVQEELGRSEENFKTVIEKMPEGVMIVDHERVLLVNSAFATLLGYLPEGMKGRPTNDFIDPDHRTVVRQRVDRIYGKGGSNEVFKLKLVGRDDRSVEVESSSISIQLDGKPAVMAILRDITLQKQFAHQAALNEKLATVGTLAAGVAHEINNPLTYLLANLVFLVENFDHLKVRLEEKGCIDEEGLKLFKEIGEEMADSTKGGERIRDIVRGLKSFVRTDEDEIVAVDLNQTVESAVQMTLHEIKKRARIEKEFTPGLPFLALNPGKLQQVFVNLLINAAQSFGDRGPEMNLIRVRTGQKEGILFVEFTDTGKGIPEKVIPRIFDPFFTTKAVGSGTGLGLSICEEIVKRYHGTIEVQSQVGVGTTFTVYLPLRNGFKVVEAAIPKPLGQDRGRVLVVDDEPGNLEVLHRLLKKKNEVLTAVSGLDALMILEREKGRVDSVVSDLNMPDMSGMELYKIVAQKFPGLEKRFVFITGGIFTPESRDFLKGIPNPCLEKPFKFEEFLQAVAHWNGVSATAKTNI